MKGRPSGYSWTVRDREVVVSHHGVEATVLTGERARQFVREAERGDEQLLMARVVGGTYKKLVGDFADSPIVAIAGDRNQWTGAAGLALTF